MKTEYIGFDETEIECMVDFMANHLTREITDLLARRSMRPDGTFARIRCLLQVMDKMETAYETIMKEKENE